MKFIAWLFMTALVGAIYFGIAAVLCAIVETPAVDTPAYIVAGALTALVGIVFGAALAGTDV